VDDTRQLWQRIADAEWMAKHGYTLEQIEEQTRLSKITTYCTVARVLGSVNGYSGLQKNRKDE
jgi:hypothetical protein